MSQRMVPNTPKYQEAARNSEEMNRLKRQVIDSANALSSRIQEIANRNQQVRNVMR